MIQLFGLTLQATTLDRDDATALATQIGAAATSVQQGAPTSVAAAARQDARRYLDARRRGELRFDGFGGRACDDGARTILRLTLSAPPAVVGAPELLVA